MHLPPPPPGTRYVKVPWLGVVVSNDPTRAQVNRAFHWPMIVLALAILPLLAIELLQKPTGNLALTVDIGFALIWLAFLIEFVIKIAIAESRFDYVKRNWLDLVIILLPLLRPLRLGSLARTGRVFRLRGVGMKLVQHVLAIVAGLEVTERLIAKWRDEDSDTPDKMTREQLVDEVRRLRKLTQRWEGWYDEHKTEMPTPPSRKGTETDALETPKVEEAPKDAEVPKEEEVPEKKGV